VHNSPIRGLAKEKVWDANCGLDKIITFGMNRS
jgi:hypothetical protein